MTFAVIASNSMGNAYILRSATDTLLIECGISFMKIKKALNFNLANVHAIVTHSHGDHSVSMADVMNAGIDVYSGEETFKSKGLFGHRRAKYIEHGITYKIGSFRVKPFSLEHDVPCFGFIITHEECGNVLFITDTCYSKYTFPGMNNIIIEANNSEDIIESNATPQFLRDRIAKSHMTIETCKELLLANDLSKVNNIVLVHLSDSNSNAARFKKEVEQISGKTVFIAEAGLQIKNFSKNPI